MFLVLSFIVLIAARAFATFGSPLLLSWYMQRSCKNFDRQGLKPCQFVEVFGRHRYSPGLTCAVLASPSSAVDPFHRTFPVAEIAGHLVKDYEPVRRWIRAWLASGSTCQ